MELRIRPKSDYLHKASFADLVVLTEHWQNDLEFCHDEINFLKKLIDKYFIWLIDEKFVAEVEVVTKKLLQFEEQCIALTQRVKKHYKHLEELEENAFSHDEQKFRDEHAALEDSIADFIKTFRLLKKEAFSVSEKAISEEKLNHLIQS